MRIFDNIEKAAPVYERGIGLGFFDGVHCGHQELLRTLAHKCRSSNLQSAVFTFPLHPLQLLGRNQFPGYIASRAERIHKIEACGVDEIYLQPFDENFSQLSPFEFLNTILLEKMNARLIVAGSDYRFGRNGSGDINYLKKWAEKAGVKVEVISQVRMWGDKVSSSRIRSLIKEGNVSLAGRMLGSAYKIRGTVITGRGLGLKLGFPTANQIMPSGLVCPAYGVYATRTTVGNKTYDSVTNVGLRPTVDPDNRIPLIETYLYETDQKLYGQTITVEFLEMIRPELSFASLEELKQKIAIDLEQVREWHDSCEILSQREVVNGIPYYWLPTRRFARSVMYLIFSCPVESRLYTTLSLTARILVSCCRKFPERSQLSAELNSLYGSDVDVSIEKKGDLQLVVFSVESLTCWTDNSSPFAAACRLLFDMLLDPLVDETGMFPREIVEAQRQSLLLEHLSRENDRSRYSYDRFISLACGSEPHGVPDLGDRDILRELSREDLAAGYKKLLEELQVVCVGSGIPDSEILADIAGALQRLPRNKRPLYFPGKYPSPLRSKNTFRHLEEKNIQQSRIVISCAGMPPYFSCRSVAASVLNNMLGGDVHSLLFDEVREKQGLAYSVYSFNQRYISLLIIMAGVSTEKMASAEEIIRAQIARLAAGDFPDLLLQRSKNMIRTALLSVDDDIHSMLDRQVSGMIHGRYLRQEDTLDLLGMVDRQDIISMANNLVADSVFLLRGNTKINPGEGQGGHSHD